MQPRDAENLTPSDARTAKAQAWLVEHAATLLDEQVELARTPAPPFHERERGELIQSKLDSLGVEAAFDEIGNLLAWYPRGGSAATAAPVIVAAHLDTVFGPEIAIEIEPEGTRWVGPGITDNARGLTSALAVLKALVHAGIEPHHPILFAFTVGEEGSGDLRGVKHLLKEGSRFRDAEAFIAVDGTGLRRIVHQALGSRRFRVRIGGPGGHSWTDWGRVNPANVIGGFIQRLSNLALPAEPSTTLTVARLGGGTSINAIPAEAWVELDLRSKADQTLSDMEARIRDSLAESVAAEEERAEGSLEVGVDIIGERPAGSLAAGHHLVRAAEEATRGLGEEPEHAVSSTDANVALALGIPAIAIGGGGESGDTHTTNEWFADTDGASGSLRLLSILAAIARF
jgi:acetylornithine deacetylase/succinyl-diaminopimelate desuccinylase-like protein